MSKQVYESAYGATRKITAEARLAEIACTRIAAKSSKSLRLRFWIDEEWRNTFLLQQKHAISLLRVHSEQAVFKAFEANAWIFSLNFAGLVKFILEEEAKLDNAIKRIEEHIPDVVSSTTPPRSAVGRPSLRSKLKDL